MYAAEKKETAVSVDCPEDLTVSHDSKWTSEALFNLLDNAVKYTPAGGKIAVLVVLWEMYVEIKVTDTGKGISESNQAAIFRRFYREEEVHEQQDVYKRQVQVCVTIPLGPFTRISSVKKIYFDTSIASFSRFK